MAQKDAEMISPTSSQIMGVKAQSESEQLPRLQQELERCPSSVGGLAMRTGTDVPTESAASATTSVDVAEDPGTNLFPVRAGQSCPLVNIYNRFPGKAPPATTFTNVRDVSGVAVLIGC